MSYTRGVPQATDRISDTQVPIQTNFNLLDSDLGVDHFQPTANVNGQQASPGSSIGYHRQVTLPPVAATLTAPATTGVEYSLSITSGAVTGIFPYWAQGAGATAYPVVPIRAFVSIKWSAISSGANAVLVQNANVMSVKANGNIISGANTYAYDVVFLQPQPFTVNTYEYLIMMNYTVNGSANTVWNYSASAVSTTGFTIQLNRLPDSGTSDPARINIFILQL